MVVRRNKVDALLDWFGLSWVNDPLGVIKPLIKRGVALPLTSCWSFLRTSVSCHRCQFHFCHFLLLCPPLLWGVPAGMMEILSSSENPQWRGLFICSAAASPAWGWNPPSQTSPQVAATVFGSDGVAMDGSDLAGRESRFSVTAKEIQPHVPGFPFRWKQVVIRAL